MQKLLLGIEHLMCGVILKCDSHMTFERESSSIVRVLADTKIEAYFKPIQSWIESTDCEQSADEYSAGEVEYYAQVVAPAMVDLDNRTYDMQTYKRTPMYEVNGQDSRYAPGEPSRYPEPVIKAMRRKYGAKANDKLADLRWERDHWYLTENRMYIGVEPDGYIHT